MELKEGEIVKTEIDLTNRIRAIINERGLKQKFIAEHMGISPKKLSDMLNGRIRIYPDDIFKICSALGVTPNDIYGVGKSA